MLLALPGGDRVRANRFAGKCSLVPSQIERLVDGGPYAYLTIRSN
jgi:hypothetical protein